MVDIPRGPMREGIHHEDWPSVVMAALLDIEDCQIIKQPVIGTVILDEVAKFLFDRAESVSQVRLRKIGIHRDGVQADLDTKVCNRGHKTLQTFLETVLVFGNYTDDIINIHPARNGHLARPIQLHWWCPCWRSLVLNEIVRRFGMLG